MTAATCSTCHRVLRVGEEVWADDWFVADIDGDRTEVRYVCDDCVKAVA